MKYKKINLFDVILGLIILTAILFHGFYMYEDKDNVWNDREFTVNKRSIIKKEATLTALGASGAVISKHFDVIIGDDLVGLENARTEKQRSNLKEWFYSSLFPTLEPDGEIHILGTRYNPLDLYEDLIKSKLPSKMFSQSYKPLVEAFDKATPVIGDKAKKLFEDFAKECDIIYKKQQETFNTQHEKIKEQYRSGAIDWKKYNSLFKKLQKEVNEEADNKRRALFGGGVSGLQDIYDAVSKGTFRDTGQVTYGHGSAYYTDRRRTNPNCSESLANYASLCVGHPELIDILAEDYPEIVTALRGCVEAMLKEVPK